jgi:hypothetical protein
MSDYLRFLELLVNWGKNYITDITTVPLGSDCPANYEFWHNGNWPGITTGCSCIGREYFNSSESLDTNGDFQKLVTNNKCTQLQLNSKCESSIMIGSLFNQKSKAQKTSHSLFGKILLKFA